MHTDDHDVTGFGGSAAELKELLGELAGVADIDVDLRDGSPHLRVWLDGSVSADEVGGEIRAAMARGPRQATEAQPAPGPVRVRRSGLGKGLGELLLANGDAVAPSHFALPYPEPTPQFVLVLVAVEETAGGVSVRAGDSGGGIAFSPVADPRSINEAIASAVARLRQERPLPRLAGVEIRDVEGSSVLTVVLARADGRRTVGSALVEGGMPFTLGKAVWEALATSG